MCDLRKKLSIQHGAGEEGALESPPPPAIPLCFIFFCIFVCVFYLGQYGMAAPRAWIEEIAFQARGDRLSHVTPVRYEDGHLLTLQMSSETLKSGDSYFKTSAGKTRLSALKVKQFKIFV